MNKMLQNKPDACWVVHSCHLPDADAAAAACSPLDGL